MVFKPFTHLARQSFAKTFTHGYAQSVVAASQSSYASSTTSLGTLSSHGVSRFSKAGTPQLQGAFANASGSQSSGFKAGHAGNTNHADGGLAAYYAAWQQEHNGDGETEWKQFQFAKRIGWKAASVAKDGRPASHDADNVRSAHRRHEDGRTTVERAQSASAIDDIKEVDALADEVTTIARVDAEKAKEIARLSSSSSAADYPTEDPSPSQAPSKSTDVVARYERPAASEERSSVDDAAKYLSDAVNSPELQAYEDQLVLLRDEHRYAEIPAVFEALLATGAKPTILTYNVLLAAAINIPRSKHQVVPRALAVYTDLLGRGVLPDTTTFSTLIELLASRAQYVLKETQILEARRARFAGTPKYGDVLIRSDEAERRILAEDDSAAVALKLFGTAISMETERPLAATAYESLIIACAGIGNTVDMIKVYENMESRAVLPSATIFPSMIEAFAASGDLSSAVECYNEYKALAMATDSGRPALSLRADDDVYAAVVGAYAQCGKESGALRFFGKVKESAGEGAPNQQIRHQQLNDLIIASGLVQPALDQGQFSTALQRAQGPGLSLSVRNRVLTRVCIAAADNDQLDIATKAYDKIALESGERLSAATSMLLLHLRREELNIAKSFWAALSAEPIRPTSSFVEMTATYTLALVAHGEVEEGVTQARRMFSRMRSAIEDPTAQAEFSERVDESIEVVGHFMAQKGIHPSLRASMDLFRTMIENGGINTSTVEHLLASLGPDNVQALVFDDLVLVAQVQAGIIQSGTAPPDIAMAARFAHLVEAILSTRGPIDSRTALLISQNLPRISECADIVGASDLLRRWQAHLHGSPQPAAYQESPSPHSLTGRSPAAEDTADPYSATTDYKGSMVIAEELEKTQSSHATHLGDALVKLKHIRAAGRHPRYATYAKLISAAAREHRINLVHDLLAMARSDVPLQPQYRVVRQGWIGILDAMVGACLSLNRRELAGQYHRELLDVGAAPSANTYGLYITTLKESMKTSDEAAEAVKIFRRARSEGVEPSSFLYNALIGKLGKARRIDDCLSYFAEMRTLGIRPTSVTYGTIVNALCRVSDEALAEELFDEMEAMPNYKPRPAPYNSLMQFFLSTRRDRSKVLSYYHRMRATNIQPTMHTYKLLIDAYATLDPVDMPAAEAVLDLIRQSGQRPEAIHYAALVHAKGCVLHDLAGARAVFDAVLADKSVRAQACLYQAMFEAAVANHRVRHTESILSHMSRQGVAMTPYIANTLIHGWAQEHDIVRSRIIYDGIGLSKREPSTYEAMVKAYLLAEDRPSAMTVVHEMMSRGYPTAVANKILDLVHGGNTLTGSNTTRSTTPSLAAS
ncbi:MAG: hypothetical protein M1817_005284 [Caeruleum heppii]|nr:MAG: hypothetical protein M1817_005284 [Caeruleum heppii]